MVPTLTPASMLLDPSRGSKTTQLHCQLIVDPMLREDVLGSLGVTNDDSLINLLRDHDATFPTSPQSIDHDIVTQYIQFLLVFTLDICCSG